MFPRLTCPYCGTYYVEPNDPTCSLCGRTPSDVCDYGHKALALRLDTGGGAGVFLCRRHWREEMRWRRDRNAANSATIYADSHWPILPWPEFEE